MSEVATDVASNEGEEHGRSANDTEDDGRKSARRASDGLAARPTVLRGGRLLGGIRFLCDFVLAALENLVQVKVAPFGRRHAEC